MFELPKEVELVIHTIENAGFEAVLVGGPVRDLLCGTVPHDWDIATSAKPEEITALFPKTIPTGVRHGTVTVCVEKMMFEVTTFRKEAAYLNHRKPQSVSFVSALEEDLKRRDFTVNAMAYRLTGEVVDLFGGREDLEKGVIRAVGQATERFEEDALRILRAVRFACKLDFEPEQETLAAMREKAALLQYISAERIASELTAALCAPAVSRFMLLLRTGLTAYCLPELAERRLEKWQDTIDLLCRLPARKALRLAALFFEDDDAEKGAETARQTLKRLKTDNQTIQRTETVLRCGTISYPMSALALKQLVRKAGEDLAEDVLWFGFAKTNTAERAQEQTEQTMRQYREIKERGEPIFLRDLQISGRDLQTIGAAGAEIGQLLQKLLEWVTEHPEQNETPLLLKQARRMRGEYHGTGSDNRRETGGISAGGTDTTN